MTNMNELAQKTTQELTTMASELRAQIRDMRFKISSRQFTKVHLFRDAKRTLARVLTAMRRNSSSTT